MSRAVRDTNATIQFLDTSSAATTLPADSAAKHHSVSS
jgi:hypothetical protein